MAQITVIKDDKAIYKDGIAINGCDMSGFPNDLWSLHWYGSNGEIEYTDALKPKLIISSEAEIESALGVSLSTLIERRDARIAEIKATPAPLSDE